MPPESDALEMAPIDRLREVLDPRSLSQMVTLKEAEAWFGIELNPEEREKYQRTLEIAAQELVRLVENRVYESATLRRHGAYLYPQLPRIAVKSDVVAITVASLQERFGARYKGKTTFGAMNPSVARQITRALPLERVSPAWILAFTQPFGGRRSEALKEVRGNLVDFNKGKGRFEVARVQNATCAALMEALKPVGSSKRGEDGETQRLTESMVGGRQVWVNRRVDKHANPLIEINRSVSEFKNNQGFFIAWEFPVI